MKEPYRVRQFFKTVLQQVHHFMWELLCAGFLHSAGLHAEVILDGATCQPRELGDVRDVLIVLVVL